MGWDAGPRLSICPPARLPCRMLPGRPPRGMCASDSNSAAHKARPPVAALQSEAPRSGAAFRCRVQVPHFRCPLQVPHGTSRAAEAHLIHLLHHQLGALLHKVDLGHPLALILHWVGQLLHALDHQVLGHLPATWQRGKRGRTTAVHLAGWPAYASRWTCQTEQQPCQGSARTGFLPLAGAITLPATEPRWVATPSDHCDGAEDAPAHPALNAAGLPSGSQLAKATVWQSSGDQPAALSLALEGYTPSRSSAAAAF